MTHPLRLMLTRGHWWGAPTSRQCPLGSGSKLPLPTVCWRAHIPTTHHHDVGCPRIIWGFDDEGERGCRSTVLDRSRFFCLHLAKESMTRKSSSNKRHIINNFSYTPPHLAQFTRLLHHSPAHHSESIIYITRHWPALLSYLPFFLF